MGCDAFWLPGHYVDNGSSHNVPGIVGAGCNVYICIGSGNAIQLFAHTFVMLNMNKELLCPVLWNSNSVPRWCFVCVCCFWWAGFASACRWLGETVTSGIQHSFRNAYVRCEYGNVSRYTFMALSVLHWIYIVGRRELDGVQTLFGRKLPVIKWNSGSNQIFC